MHILAERKYGHPDTLLDQGGKMHSLRIKPQLILLLVGISLLVLAVQPQQPALSAPTTYVVSNTKDDGANGSLRNAINAANANLGQDTIVFNIPFVDPNYYAAGGYFTIPLLSPLPNLTDPLGTIIDGTSQGANKGDTNPVGPEIEIVPALEPFANPFFILDSDNNVIKGLALEGSEKSAIKVYGSSNRISQNYLGVDPKGLSCWKNLNGVEIRPYSDSNVIENNIIASKNDGIILSDSQLNLISGNIIGVNVNKMIFSNLVKPGEFGNDYFGIHLKDNSVQNTIKENYIADNHRYGIYLEGTGTQKNILYSNTITANGWHGIGIYYGAHHNGIGKVTPPIYGNVITKNGWSGVAIVENSNQNTVAFNMIQENNYYGVDIVDSVDNFVMSNTLSHNGVHTASAGVHVNGMTATGNNWLNNRIYDNNDKGIQLVNGANEGITPPTIHSASCTLVQGTSACPGCIVFVYSDQGDQGRKLERMVYADAGGNFTSSGPFFGPNITVTQQDGNANASSFSLPYINACMKFFIPILIK